MELQGGIELFRMFGTTYLKGADEVNKQVDTLGKKAETVGEKFTKFGAKLGSVGKGLTMGLTTPILGAATAAFKLASDMAETMNKVSVAFGDNSKQVMDWSKTSLQSFGMAKQSALDMAALFGDMGTAMGQSTAEAAAMSTSLVGLAGDLASFKNIGVQQASDALKGIFTGEGEALKSLGVIMLDSTLQAFALEQGQKKLYKEMTQAEKVALRYAYVMDATKNSQGDFARTSDGAANQMRIFTESVKELGAQLGEKLLPIITPLITKAVELVQKFGALDDKTQNTILTFAGIVAAVGPATMVIGKLTEGVGFMIPKFQAASKVISGGGGFTKALGALIGPAGIATLVVAAIAAVAYVMGEQSKAAREATEKVKALTDSWKASADAYKTNLSNIDATSSATETLTRKLYDLNSKQGKSNEDMALMADYVRQLNDIMPELNLEIDDQTGLLNKQVGAVNEIIKVKKEQMKTLAEEQRLLDLYAQQFEALKQTKIANQQLRAESKIDMGESIWEWASGIKEGKKQVELLKIATGVMNDEVVDLEKSMDDAARGMENGSRKATEAAWLSYDKMADKVRTAGDKTIETVQEITEVTEEEKARLKEIGEQRYQDRKRHIEDMAAIEEKRMDELNQFHDDLESAAEDNMNKMGNIEDEGIQKTELTGKQMMRNLKKQIADWKDWHAGIAELAKRVPEDVMAELKELGPGFDPIIDDMNKMTDEKLNETVDLWREKGALARDEAIEELQGAPAMATTAGQNLAKNFADGIDAFIANIKAAAKRASKAAKLGPFQFKGAVNGEIGMETYHSGTDFVPETGPAILKRGEAVLTEEENRNRNTPGPTIVINNPKFFNQNDAKELAGIIYQRWKLAGAGN